MEIIFLASSMANRGEHSYRVIEEVGAALQSRDISYRIFSTRTIEPEIAHNKAVVPHFTHSLYEYRCVYNNLGPILTDPSFRWIDEVRGGAQALEFVAGCLHRCWHGPFPETQSKYVPLEHRDWKAFNKSYYADLCALPKNVWAPGNLIIVTATSQNQIRGLVEFLREKHLPQSLPVVICHLMFPPNWSPSGRAARMGTKFYRMALKQGKPIIGKTLFFTTENKLMAEAFDTEFGIESRILPVPLRAHESQRRKDDEKVRIGFFGYSKSDKGFHLLPEVATICRNKGIDVEFQIQVQHSNWEQATIQAEQALRRMPNVHLIEGSLGSKDYLTEMSKVDVVLLPYDPKLFGMRGSGIFTESVAAGRPIIASERTFAAESLKKGEAQGEIFAPHNAQACADAIERLLPRLAACRERAMESAETFTRRHNGEAYVDVLLSYLPASSSNRACNDNRCIATAQRTQG
jgi:glycosyltransferase involved in cell wall biosynthesis